MDLQGLRELRYNFAELIIVSAGNKNNHGRQTLGYFYFRGDKYLFLK
jgi:hypothetical protein